ncbi:MAG TPA: hypothetical protein VGC85_05475 [Chthoniobacterales bacterium]
MNFLSVLPVVAENVVTPARSGAPLRVFAAILLVLILSTVIYVLRHLTKVKEELREDDIVPTERGARDNMLFLVCAVTFLAVCLLLFLLVKA